MKHLLLLPSLLVLSCSLFAQIPSGYYNGTADLTRDELKASLYNIIKGHKKYPYTGSSTDTWDILKEADADPEDSDYVIGIYSEFKMLGAEEYNSAQGWSREHIWAKSRGDFDENSTPGSDVHHLRAEDVSTNSARNNRNFGYGNQQYVDQSGNYKGSTNSKTSTTGYIWEPHDAVKGDIARMIFYMATRYEGENGDPDLELAEEDQDSGSKAPLHAKLSVLLEWHHIDPVDDVERKRNDVIYTYQNNRNPFIDHPEFVELIWGEESVDVCTASNFNYQFSTDSLLFVYEEENVYSNIKSYAIQASGINNELKVTPPIGFELADNQNFNNAVLAGDTLAIAIEGTDFQKQFFVRYKITNNTENVIAAIKHITYCDSIFYFSVGAKLKEKVIIEPPVVTGTDGEITTKPFVYPNPITANFKINVAENTQLQLYGLKGELILSTNNQSALKTVLQKVKPSTYTLVVIAKGQVYFQRLVKE